MNAEFENFLYEFVPRDCRDQARERLMKITHSQREKIEEMQHESDIAVMLEEQMEE